ncbi:MAG: cytochrome-c oxidase, cbb3-type subunit III [Alphaproteobacteria bacterium]|nr:cytochrome-c oxidase, cbb3-type subunit III [Alphaproteobacteria bacterium]
MPTKLEKDAVTGKETTGHEWDGVRELNNPLPKWWLYVFAATVVWALGFMVFYPSVPYGPGYFHGLLGYSTRHDAMAGWRRMEATHAAAMQQIATLPFDDIRKDPQLMAVALTAGRATFANNCQPCHGPNGEGRRGYPALGDDVWLWGGKLTDILQTVTHGIRSTDPDTRNSQMPDFAGTGTLKPVEIQQVANYVMTLYGAPVAGADPASGRAIFMQNCAVCHGEEGQGNHEVGAPPLASHTHLYGADRAAVVAQITHAHNGMMPNWGARLDPATLKSVALYVHSLGGGE